jgi:alkanesulfonate monooxygenase SsuD/methylene tetrahydromethanopterin reductase-like flavin-dependent oxidoreductase (luciferase family)
VKPEPGGGVAERREIPPAWPRPVKLALCLDGLPAGDLPAIAAEAERRGFQRILAAETTGVEPFVACAAMAAATRSILVGTGIAGVHGRSAASIAMAAASLAALSGDRFVLGLGLQSKRLVEELHGTTYGGLGAMRETIHVVRRTARGRSRNLRRPGGADRGTSPRIPATATRADPHGGPRAPHARTVRRGRRRPARLVLVAGPSSTAS